MSSPYAAPVQALIDELGRLPGIGPKSAQRIAFYLLKLPKEDALRLARAIAEVKDKVSFCTRCFNVAEGELCEICVDARRDATSRAAAAAEHVRTEALLGGGLGDLLGGGGLFGGALGRPPDPEAEEQD